MLSGQHILVARARVHVTPQILHVQLHHARWLGPVDQRYDALRPCHLAYFLHRHDETVGVVDMADGEEPGLRRNARFHHVYDFLRVLEHAETGIRDIHHLEFQAVSLRAKGHHVLHPPVVIVGRQNLIAPFQIQPHESESHAIGGAVREGDFLDIRSHETGHVLPNLVHAAEKVGRPAHGRIGIDCFHGIDLRLVDAQGRNAPCAGIHVYHAVAKQELGRHLLPVCLVIGCGAAIRRVGQIGQRCRFGFLNRGQQGRRTGQPGRAGHHAADESAAGQTWQLIRVLNSGVEWNSSFVYRHEKPPSGIETVPFIDLNWGSVVCSIIGIYDGNKK